MNFISPETKADHIGIIDATVGYDLVTLVPEIERMILTPEFSSVVICRNSQTLSESFNTVSPKIIAGLEQKKSFRIILSHNEKFAPLLELHDSPDGHIVPLEKVENFFGADISEMEKLLCAMGHHNLEIRCLDGNNKDLHTDSDFITIEQLKAKIPFTISATMAIRGNGTDIADCGAEAFLFERCGGYPTYRNAQPNLAFLYGLDAEIFTVRSGDIALMRTGHNPSRFLPSLHRSSFREEDGNPQTSLKAIGALMPS